MSATSHAAGSPPASGDQRRFFGDLQAHNRYARRVADLLREQRERRIARVIQTQRKHRIHQSR